MDDAGDGPRLEEVYDAETLAALDRWAPGAGAEPLRRGGRVGAGALLVGLALGLRDAFDDDRGDPVVEPDPGGGPEEGRWVTFVYVPGAPAASRIIVRPWLARA